MQFTDMFVMIDKNLNQVFFWLVEIVKYNDRIAKLIFLNVNE